MNNHNFVCFPFKGTAVVTETKAALWTDGRYYLQAASQLDSNWILMKDGNDKKAKKTKRIDSDFLIFFTAMGKSVITLFSALVSQFYNTWYGYN